MADGSARPLRRAETLPSNPSGLSRGPRPSCSVSGASPPRRARTFATSPPPRARTFAASPPRRHGYAPGRATRGWLSTTRRRESGATIPTSSCRSRRTGGARAAGATAAPTPAAARIGAAVFACTRRRSTRGDAPREHRARYRPHFHSRRAASAAGWLGDDASSDESQAEVYEFELPGSKIEAPEESLADVFWKESAPPQGIEIGAGNQVVVDDVNAATSTPVDRSEYAGDLSLDGDHGAVLFASNEGRQPLFRWM